jgi:hypothetical protein
MKRELNVLMDKRGHKRTRVAWEELRNWKFCKELSSAD